MLTLRGDRFTCGRANFSDFSPHHPEPTAKVYVKVRFGSVNFLGYTGLLDSIRFALDPQVNHFYFGPGL